MALKRKLKKVNKTLLTIYLAFSLSYLISIILLTINLSYLANVETTIRIIFIVLMFIFWFIYLLYGFIWVFEKKNIKLIIMSFFILIFIPINIVASIYINKTYRVIDNMNKENITYTTSLITLKGYTFKDSNSTDIGLINDDDDIGGNVLAKELINDKNITESNFQYYEEYEELIDLLYKKELDAIFLPTNYESEDYSNLENETDIIYTATKNVLKDDSAYSTKSVNEPFTILLLGMDTTANSANFNGDSIMLITFNPKTLMATSLSIPRDTYVPITCRNNREAKINSAAAKGVECMSNTITNFMDIDIDYYIKMNFNGLIDLVNAVGGITIDIEKPTYNTFGNNRMCEQNSKREFGSKMVCLNPGLQDINGEEALAYARNRHQYAGGDFARGKHQQEIVVAIINKLKNIRNIDSFLNILNAVSENMDTNMSNDTILSFYNIGKKIVMNYLSSSNDLIKIQKLYLQTSTLNIAGAGSTEQYHKRSLTLITNAMKYNLGIEEPVLNKTFNYNVNEIYEEVPLGRGIYDTTTRKTFPGFINKTRTDASTWANNNNINVTFVDVGIGDSKYNDELEDGTIIDQSVNANTLLENISSIIFYVIKKS